MGYSGQLASRHPIHDDSDSKGWNGWLYPVLFIVLPIVASLMVLALIACNIYEYYQKKKRLQQYQHYCQNSAPTLDTEPDKRQEDCSEICQGKGFNGYNEAQFTYSTIFGNYVCNEENRAPVRPMSGWVAPHM